MGGRLWTLACSASIATRIHLRSVPPFCHPIPYLSLMNVVTFFISSNSQIPQSSSSSSSSIIYHLHPLYSYSSRPITRCCLSQCCCSLLLSSFQARSLPWEHYFLYALPSSALITRTTHTFFRNFTRTHIFLPPAYLNVRNKQKGFRSRTAAPRMGPQRWIRIICMTPRLVPPPGAILHTVQ